MSALPDPLLRFRSEFPILEKTTYLISNSLGAMPRAARLVMLSHVLFKSAFVVDVPPIAQQCRREGAVLAVDAYQSVGTLPVSVADLGADVLVGGVLKWLCGGPGGAFLWVRPEIRSRIRPSLTGWMAHPKPFDFEPPQMRWRDDAFRFLLGTPAVPALYAGREGPLIVRKAGVEAIRAKSLRQTGRLLELARERDFRSSTPVEPARRGGAVAVDFEHALEVSRELNARDDVVHYRPGSGIRMSPHFYTTDEELDRAFSAIDEIRASEEWRRCTNQPAIVT
jgi:kynureninase